MTRSGLLSTKLATALSAGLNISIALLIRNKQPAFKGATCLVLTMRSKSPRIIVEFFSTPAINGGYILYRSLGVKVFVRFFSPVSRAARFE
jgi:hypothetical protein